MGNIWHFYAVPYFLLDLHGVYEQVKLYTWNIKEILGHCIVSMWYVAAFQIERKIWVNVYIECLVGMACTVESVNILYFK